MVLLCYCNALNFTPSGIFLCTPLKEILATGLLHRRGGFHPNKLNWSVALQGVVVFLSSSEWATSFLRNPFHCSPRLLLRYLLIPFDPIREASACVNTNYTTCVIGQCAMGNGRWVCVNTNCSRKGAKARPSTETRNPLFAHLPNLSYSIGCQRAALPQVNSWYVVSLPYCTTCSSNQFIPFTES